MHTEYNIWARARTRVYTKTWRKISKLYCGGIVVGNVVSSIVIAYILATHVKYREPVVVILILYSHAVPVLTACKIIWIM